MELEKKEEFFVKIKRKSGSGRKLILMGDMNGTTEEKLETQ